MDNLDKLIAAGILGEMEKSATKWRQLYRAGQLGAKSVGRLMNHPTTKHLFQRPIPRSATSGKVTQGVSRASLIKTPPTPGTGRIRTPYMNTGRPMSRNAPDLLPKPQQTVSNTTQYAQQQAAYTARWSNLTRRPKLHRIADSRTLARNIPQNAWSGRFDGAVGHFTPATPAWQNDPGQLLGRLRTPSRPSVVLPQRWAASPDTLLGMGRHETGHWAQMRGWKVNPTGAARESRFIDTVMRQADPAAYKRLYANSSTTPLTEIQGHYLGSLRGHGGARLRQATAANWQDPYANAVRNWNTTHAQQLPQQKLDAIASSLEHVRRNYGMNTGGGPARPYLP